MYDELADIRDFYRSQLRRITTEISTLGRRDPGLHTLWAERKVLRAKLDNLTSEHNEPTGALRDYGTW